MLFFVILIIALGWAGWLWAWSRERYVSRSGLGLPPSPFAPAPASPLSAPRTAARARRRRREVLAALGTALVLSYLWARSWSFMWLPTAALVMAFAVYARAVFELERTPVEPGSMAAMPLRARLGPVIDDAGPVRAAPGPMTRAE